MTPSLEGSPTKAKQAPSPHEVRLAPLDTNPVLHCLRVTTILQCFSMQESLGAHTLTATYAQQYYYPNPQFKNFAPPLT